MSRAPRPSSLLSIAAALVGAAGCAASHGPSPDLTLRRVVLYQNGSGYFERTGRVSRGHLEMRFAPHEVDDVLATLTVIDQGPTARPTVVAASVPHVSPEDASGARSERRVTVDLALSGGHHRSLLVAYSVPTAAWRATYRVVLPEARESRALLQMWALVHNASEERWDHVALSLATASPLAYAFDLRTPRLVPRPDVTGRMVTPPLYGAVSAETAREPGDDMDGVPLESDLCPAEPEDLDGFEDTDGCPEPDNDGDGIADVNDQCPAEPEVYNGLGDDDGCPDRGLVVVQESQLRILEQLYFAPGESEVRPGAVALVDSIAATLRGNPRITTLEIRGHTAGDEPGGWALSAARAASVRALLIARGIEASRLRIQAFGPTQPVDARATADARERNRRVDFRVVSLETEEPATEATAGAPAAARRIGVESQDASAPGRAIARELLGAARYDVSEPVSIGARSAALVTIASARLEGQDVLLFRPDGAAPSSAEHPYRAAFLRNTTRMTLVPGPVALFARGSFVGEGLIDHLRQGDTTFIPYAIDGSCDVHVSSDDTSVPARIVSARRDRVTLEDTRLHHTHFVVEPGEHTPERIFLQHLRLAGYESVGLPPGSVPGSSGDLVPIPLTPRRTSRVTVDQRAPERRTISLSSDLSTDLGPYLPSVPAAERQRLATILDRRATVARIERDLGELRSRISDAAQRSAELRQSITTLDEARQRALVRQLTERLREAIARGEELARTLQAATAEAAAARAELGEAMDGLVIVEPATRPPPAQLARQASERPTPAGAVSRAPAP